MYKYLYIFYRLQDFYAHQGYIYVIKKYSNILKYVFHWKELQFEYFLNAI